MIYNTQPQRFEPEMSTSSSFSCSLQSYHVIPQTQGRLLYQYQKWCLMEQSSIEQTHKIPTAGAVGITKGELLSILKGVLACYAQFILMSLVFMTDGGGGDSA